MHEGGISTPLIAWNPESIKAGTISRQPAHIIDLMPTVVEITGAEFPEIYKDSLIEPLPGISLLPLWQGKSLRETRENLFWEHEGNRAVRSGDWKIVSRYDYRERKELEWELYNLRDDRSEVNNLSEDHPEKVAEMIRLYESWAADNNVLPFSEIQSLRAKRRKNN